jgi:hypothetical protein
VVVYLGGEYGHEAHRRAQIATRKHHIEPSFP